MPEALARAGLEVVVKGGPGPRDYSTHRIEEGAVVRRPLGQPPERVDLVYAYRPLAELPSIAALAASLGARTVWCELAGGDEAASLVDAEARRIIESAGLAYVGGVSITDVARAVGRRE